jgi:protein TonB
MAAAAPLLRVIEGGGEPRVAFATAPELRGPPAADRIPLPRRGWSSVQILGAVILSVAVHAGVIWWGMQQRADEEARAAGGADNPILIEGESVILLDSMPSDASDGLPEATAASETAKASFVASDTPAVSVADAPSAVSDTGARPMADDAIAPTRTATLPARTVEDESARAVPNTAARPDDSATARTVHDDIRTAEVASAEVTAETGAVLNADPVPDAKAVAVETSAVLPADPVPESKVAAVDANAAPADDVKVKPVAEAAAIVEGTAARPVDADASTSPGDAKVAAIEEEPTAVKPPPPAKPVTKPKPAPRTEQRAASVANEAARGPAPGTAGAGGKSTEERGRADSSAYQAKLAAHLRRFRTFPPEARDKGITGTAIVRFTVTSSGSVSAASLAKSSGAGVLDQAAVAMVRRASPFPPIPAGLGSSLTVNVPVRFDLR